MTTPLLLAWLILLAHVCRAVCDVKLTDNRYTGVVIVIGDDVQYDQRLIPAIQGAFRDASQKLFVATNKRAFFSEVTIVVPPHWTDYVAKDEPLFINQFKEHIRVDTPSAALNTTPYVRGNMECGRPGWYMHLTPEFLLTTDPTPYGTHGNVIVHEWGHLRWGLYDEYPSLNAPGNTGKIQFYQSGGQWRPVTCTRLIEGTADKGSCDGTDSCNKYLTADDMPADCLFCPKEFQTFGSGGSLMAYQWLNSMESFCETDNSSTPENIRHNSEAPNMQNTKCNLQSAWEVMRQHEDFRDNNNPPRQDFTDFEQVNFNIIKRATRKRVLVLDTSGSMLGSRITKLNKAATFAIDTIIEATSWLGIVTFTDTAHVAAEMTYINNQTTRDLLKDKLPSTARGRTEIKTGLEKAVEILEKAFSSANQTEIILISDGESNNPYEYYFSTLVDKRIIVHTIAISDSADGNMTYLAYVTGGGSYTFLETESVSLVDVLSQAISAGQTRTDKLETLFVDSYNVMKTLNDSFYIDKALGKDTVIAIVLNSDSDVTATVSVAGPDDATYHNTDTTTILKLAIPGTIPAGRYYYTITLNSTVDVAIDVSVTSKPTSDAKDVIHVTSQLSSTTVDFNSADELKLYVSVEKGGSPVLRATVTAVLAADSDVTPINITLQDNGAAPDTVSNDGIYSTFLIKKFFTGKLPNKLGQKLRYNAKVFITGSQSTYTMNVIHGSAPIPGAVKEAVFTTQPVGDFQRQSFTTEIVVINLPTDREKILDTTPPAQITDLLVTDVSNNKPDGKESFTNTLTWTAVGDDMDVGQATKYSLRFNKDIRNLRDHFNMSTPVPQNLTTPKPAGGRETINITLTLQECNGTCYLAIRAADARGLESVTSNVVIIDVDFNYKSREEIERSLTTTPSPGPDNSHVIMVIGIAVGAFLVIVFGVLVVCCVWKSRSSRAQSSNYEVSAKELHKMQSRNP